jgi:D-methionine transport system substrate-binding protein
VDGVAVEVERQLCPARQDQIYSKKFKSLSDIKDGATVTIANDPTNFARALRYLQTLGLIKINPDIDASKASEKDIAENPKHLNIEPVEAAQLPRTPDSVDFSLVNGNYAIASGILADPRSAAKS